MLHQRKHNSHCIHVKGKKQTKRIRIRRAIRNQNEKKRRNTDYNARNRHRCPLIFFLKKIKHLKQAFRRPDASFTPFNLKKKQKKTAQLNIMETYGAQKYLKVLELLGMPVLPVMPP